MSNFQITNDLEVQVQLPQGLQQPELSKDHLNILPILKEIRD